MSLGSPVQWQWVLLNVYPFNDSDALELPKGVVVTIVIATTLFFLYDYINGTLIPTIALMEAPELVDIKPKPVDSTALTPMPNEFDKGPTANISIPPQDRPAGIGKYLLHVISIIEKNLILFAIIYFLFHMGVISEEYLIFMRFFVPGWAAISILLSISTDGLLFKSRANAITQKPSTVRRYLQSQGGRWAIFRGLDVFLVYILLSITVLTLAAPVLALWKFSFPRFLVARLLLGLPLTNLHMAWVHTVISRPNGKTLWQRIPGWREWLRIAPVASLDIILSPSAYYFAKYALVLICRRLPHATRYQECGKILVSELRVTNISFFAVPFVSYLLVSVITRAIYVRVAAAMLPDDVEPVVPFDRTFGGRATKDSIFSLILNPCACVTGDQCSRYLKLLSDAVSFEVFAFYALLFVVLFEKYFFASHFSLDFLGWLVEARRG